MKQFPLVSLHPQAMPAARAAVAAGLQGRYWEMHDRLFASPQLDPDTPRALRQGDRPRRRPLEA